MVETTQNGPPVDEHAPSGHETRDVNIPIVLKVGVCLIALAAGAHLLVAFLFARLDRQTERAQPKLSPLFKKAQVRLPRDLDKIPSPRLQIDDIADMNALRRYEDAILSGSGPAGPKGEFVRIPIDRALALLAKSKEARAAAQLRFKEGR